MTKHRDYSESKRAYDRQVSLSGRDIGSIPDIEDWERRELCRDDPELFCRTYNPEAFSMPFSEDHLSLFRVAKETLLSGHLHAFAMPRGSGKTSICRMLALWAVSYAIRRYVFMIGANAEKAEDNLAAVKMYARFLPLYAADFPEIYYPAHKLGGIANRASGQLCQGEPTLIEWAGDRLVMPTVPPPDNWPKHWPLRDDGMVPTSGSVISASGLTGDGIRGSLLTLNTGESLRPDFVILDDPQTNESSRSPTQNQTRLQLVSADILGMAGPGKTISALMPCTVISPGDMVDQILDRKKHPLWRGERRRMLNKMPTNMAAWDVYFEVYRDCAQREPPNYDDANAHYIEHRAALDEGAEPSWPERKLPWEVSAVQHAMHLYCRDMFAFMSEYQNQPLSIYDPAADLPKLEPDDIMKRLNNHDRGLVPTWASTLTLGTDCQQDLIYYVVCAWGENFQGAVIDYGVWPEQARTYFSLRDANPTISRVTGISEVEGAFRDALDNIVDRLCKKKWPQADGIPLEIAKGIVDSGWKDQVVYRYCRESPRSAQLIAGKGYGITAGKAPISDWQKKPGEVRQKGPSPTWTIRTNVGKGRHTLIDTNSWKTLVYERLLVPMGDKSALTLFGKKATEHRLLADHICAEFRVKTEGRGRRVEEWTLKPGHDNHFFDALCYAAVAASMQGVTLSGEPQPDRRKASAADYAKKREAFEARRRIG